MPIDKVEFMKIEGPPGGLNDGVRIIFTYDDSMLDVMELYGDDKDEILPMLAMPGTPEILLLKLRHILRLTVH